MAPPVDLELLKLAYLMMILFLNQHLEVIEQYHADGGVGLPMSFTGDLVMSGDTDSEDEEVYYQDFHDGAGIQSFCPK